MIVKAVDGKWYRNPVWSGKDAAVTVDDDTLVLKVKSRQVLAMSTLRRRCRDVGIKNAVIRPRSLGKDIMDDEFVNVYIADLILRDLPRVPDRGEEVGEPTGVEEPIWPIPLSMVEGDTMYCALVGEKDYLGNRRLRELAMENGVKLDGKFATAKNHRILGRSVAIKVRPRDGVA